MKRSLPFRPAIAAGAMQEAIAGRHPEESTVVILSAKHGRPPDYIDITCGVPPKQFIRGEWFVGTALLTGIVWILVYLAGAGTWIGAGTAFLIGFGFRLLALFQGWEEPLPRGPKGAVIHGNRRPLLGRKLAGKSQSELRDLGLVVEPPPSGKPAEDSDV
jgi:hypothetical protein